VKIRGYRIELGEIEATLLMQEQVREAVVVARQDEQGESCLCAYVVAEGEVDAAALRRYAGQTLPSYMVPAFIMQLERLPLMTNGKLDRKALPAPEGASAGLAVYVAPRTTLEAKLAEVWQLVLGVERVGAQDHFFELGGHSLKAATLVSRLHKELGVDLPLRSVFEAPILSEMAQRIEAMEQTAYTAIEPVAERAYYPVSSSQKRMYILNQLEGAELSYNMPGVYTVEGELDVARMERALQALLKRHESLRTSFELVNGEPVQRVHAEVSFQLIQLTSGETGSEEEADKQVAAFIRPFDLSEAPLFRAGVMKLPGKRHLFVYDMHHIVSDGVSMNVLVEEFSRLYVGEELLPLRLQYKDYAVWQQERLQAEELKRQEAYWLETFSGELPVLELPTDYPRPAVQQFAGDAVHTELSPEATAGLRRIASETGATLYMVLLSAYTVLLSKYSGQEDLVVGTPVAGRPHADLEPIIGMFVGTLALRNRAKREQTFKAYVEDVKRNTLLAFEHADYPLEELVERLDVRRDRSRNPLFDVMFVMQNMGVADLKMDSLAMVSYEASHEIAKFDLTLTVEDSEETILLKLQYCKALFSKETIKRVAGHLIHLLHEVAEDPETRLWELKMMTEEERKQLLCHFNDTEKNYPQEKMLHRLFEEQVDKTPDQVALVYEDERVTYAELNARSNRLARELREKGVVSDSIVAILAERSVEMIAGILAVLKAGGAYLPIAPDYPQERILYMLEDSGAGIVLTQPHLEALFNKSYAGGVVLLNPEMLESEDGSNLSHSGSATQLAYVIYTSGSTGHPKGVMVEHRSIANALHWRKEAYCMKKEDCVLELFSFAFDGFLTSLFTPLLSGASVVLLTDSASKNPTAIKEAIKTHQITHFISVPTLYQAILDASNTEELRSVQIVTLAGEAVTPKLIAESKRITPTTELANEYGPTENSVVASYLRNLSVGKRVTIGRPIANVRLIIVDHHLQLQPIGVPGEICITGAGLARGYLNNPELTAEKFIENPFAPGEQMYVSGDRGYWLPDGNICYLGRQDSNQVKINGYRIELSEIEAVLNRFGEIKENAVIVRGKDNGNKYLCAFLVLNPGFSDHSVIRKKMFDAVPAYMVPSDFIVVKKLPLNLNGKLDYKALLESNSSDEITDYYVEPSNEMEKVLANIWEEVLGVRRVGINHNFFELGGDSIKAIQVAARMQACQYQIEIKDILRNPLISELSKYVKTQAAFIEQSDVEGEVPLTPIQKWFLEQPFTEKHHFNHAVILHSETLIQEARFKKTIWELIKHHDGLRIVLIKEGTSQFNRGLDDSDLFGFEIRDLTAEHNVYERIKQESERLQASLDLERGPLLKAALFRTAKGDYLLIVLHHLVVDGVSWRILLEDIVLGYKQTENDGEVRFPTKTHSFMDWAKQLHTFAESPALLNEKTYWDRIEQLGDVIELKQDYPVQDNYAADSETVRVIMSEIETIQLLKEIHWAYNTAINDVLLTALGISIKKWQGHDQVLISMEGHGRENVTGSIDVSRTVGWFTSMYPVIIPVQHSEDLSYTLKATKEVLRNVPNKGIGYGIIRYLTPDVYKNGTQYNLQPDISFNYFGQFDQDIQNDLFTILDDELSGQSISPNMKRPSKLDISAMVVNGRLVINIEYNRKMYESVTISGLANHLKSMLIQIINHCMNRTNSEKTPSDLGHGKLALDDFEKLKKKLTLKLMEKS
jgi:amino acid adenylation domain-containing protein/non-ribosomal peptide synthase protein (TIGR01720 family)